MHNVLAASAALPVQQLNPGIIDLRVQLRSCTFDEKLAWEALENHMQRALQHHSHELHIDCSSECLRIRSNAPDGTIEHRLPADDVLLTALRLLQSKSPSSDLNSLCSRAWFLLTLVERDHVFQLDHVQSSSGGSFSIRRLYDVQNPLPQLEQLLTQDGQSAYLRKRLRQTDGLMLLADDNRVRRIRTARALAQCMTSPAQRILISETTCHPLVPGTSQITIPLDAETRHLQAWRQACDMSYDMIIGLEITHDAVNLIKLATENCQVVQGVCANSAAKSLTQLLATGARPEAIARALTSIVVQHELALACERCKCPATITNELNAILAQRCPLRANMINAWLKERLADNFVQAPGCQSCNNTGIGGTVLVVECIEVSQELQDALNDGDTRYSIDSLRNNNQLPDQLIHLAQRGLITVDHAINRLDKVG